MTDPPTTTSDTFQYRQPNARVTASYASGDPRTPDTVEVEVFTDAGDDTKFLAEIISALADVASAAGAPAPAVSVTPDPAEQAGDR